MKFKDFQWFGGCEHIPIIWNSKCPLEPQMIERLVNMTKLYRYSGVLIDGRLSEPFRGFPRKAFVLSELPIIGHRYAIFDFILIGEDSKVEQLTAF